jgi:purine-binding chemotaxis protein CheW
VALRVDRVQELVSVNREAVEPAAVAPGAEYVAGVARLTDGLLVIHDLEAFLSLDEARVLDSALARSVDVRETGRRGKRS